MAFRGLVRTIASLFSKEADGKNVRAKSASEGQDRPLDARPQHSAPFIQTTTSRPDTKPRLFDNEDARFDEGLSSLMRAKRDFLAGSLELIGLDDVQNALGVSWSTFEGPIIELSQREIRRALAPSDTFRKYGDASFLIHFSDLDRRTAETKTKRIALRIKAALIEAIPEVAQAIAVRPFVGVIESAQIEQAGGSLSDAIFTRLMRMRADAALDFQRRRRLMERDIAVSFSPVWHARKEQVLLNRCNVESLQYNALSNRLPMLEDSAEAADISAEVDYLVLAKSVDALHKLRQSGRMALLLIPVNFGTILENATRHEYVRLLGAMPIDYRRYIALEIREVDAEISSDVIFKTISDLRSLTTNTVVNLPLDDKRVTEVAASGVWGISTEIKGVDLLERSSAASLQRFATADGVKGIVTIACGADTIGLAMAAFTAGFTFIEGTSIYLSAKEPRQAFRLRALPMPPRLS